MVKIDDSMVKTDDSKYFQKEDWGYKKSKINLVLICTSFLHAIKIEKNYINKQTNYSKGLVRFLDKKGKDPKIVLNEAKIKKVTLIKLFNL